MTEKYKSLKSFLVSNDGKMLVLFVVSLLAYSPAFFAGFVWDDDIFYLQNGILQTIDGLRNIWFHPSLIPNEAHYWPLVYSTFWVEFHLWGDNPMGYHATNILLHIVDVILLWTILRRLEIPGAWWAALIFALHPVHVESVAWAIERKDVLSGMFYLLSFLCYLQFENEKKWGKYILSLVLFTCAMLSKSVVVTFPVVILLYQWWKENRIEKRTWLLSFFYIEIAAIITAFDMWLSHLRDHSAFHLSLLERCLIAGRAIWFYVWELFCPINLIAIYPLWNINVHAYWQYLFPCSLVAIVLLLWILKNRIGRSPFAAVLFFIITLSPTLGFIDFSFMGHSYVADRYQYLASIGLIVLFSAGVSMLPTSTRFNSIFKSAVYFLIPVLLAILTFQQAKTWYSLETMFARTIEKNPNTSAAHSNLGVAYAKRGLRTAAINQFIEALRIKPDQADVRNNVGVLLGEEGKMKEAAEYFKQAIQLKPDFVEAHYNLGCCYMREAKYKEAIDEFTIALKIDPYHESARKTLAEAVADQQKERKN